MIEARVLVTRSAILALLGAAFLADGCAYRVVELVATGSSRELIERSDDSPARSPQLPGLLILAIDGVNRSLLYDMLRSGELPAASVLLGGAADGRFPHAYFDESMLATLPSTTIPAWVTAITGVPPAVHGISGNEFFIREQRRLAAPIPVSFDNSSPVLQTYTADYVNELVRQPTVYEQMRARDPHVLIWVAMHQLYTGADRLVLTRRTVLVDAFEAYVQKEVSELADQKESRAVFEKLDGEVIENVVSALDDGPIPDVLTIYVSGTDLFAHVAEVGPDPARREYLREVLDPLLEQLAKALAACGALEDRYVVVTSDHGHTEVPRDEQHALGAHRNRSAVALMRAAGFRPRPFVLDTATDDDFQAVFASGGAMAYVYVADRSTCPLQGDVCDWSHPPRFREDVLELAEAFHQSNRHGASAPALRGTIDLILTRKPRPHRDDDLPFQVYVGNYELEPLGEHLRDHPHRSYVDFEARMEELAAGPLGERAGDIMLVAHNGDREDRSERYYFAAPYHSWHGSPSRGDSEIPFIVAHSRQSEAAIRRVVRSALGKNPHQQRVTDVLLALRFGAEN